jgi:hypothetical protein
MLEGIHSPDKPHQNPIIRCKKPGCDKTFTKYYIDKNGRVRWNAIRGVLL